MEQKFEDFMRQLQPNAGHKRLFREIVLDVWQKRQADSQQVRGVVSRNVRELHENKIKLEEAFVYKKAIDEQTYQEMRAKLAEELTVAEMELRDTQAEGIAVLDSAQMVLLNALDLWKPHLPARNSVCSRFYFPRA